MSRAILEAVPLIAVLGPTGVEAMTSWRISGLFSALEAALSSDS